MFTSQLATVKLTTGATVTGYLQRFWSGKSRRYKISGIQVDGGFFTSSQVGEVLSTDGPARDKWTGQPVRKA